MARPARARGAKPSKPSGSLKKKAPARRRSGPLSGARPAQVVAPKVPQAERRARLEAVLDESLTRAWGAVPVARGALGAVPVRVAALAKPRPFWHLRTHGLSASAGVEVALRVPRGKDEAHLPAWVPGVVERLALHAKDQALAAGQVVRWPRPFGEGAQTELEAFAIGLDPAFGTLSTPHDEVPVLLAVGITADEERLVREWSPSALLEVLARV
ncbi:MAG: suppressor of fused domain protein, partial [Myxococcaceae bacterium]|nr:suppressor of fused domain protein [Myxococcaceae bacterium]